MESALLAVGAIAAFIAVMAVGYFWVSRFAEGRARRRAEEAQAREDGSPPGV